MKTKLTWTHGNRVLKIDDVDYDVLPSEGDVIEMEENGVVHRFEVVGLESAEVVLEAVDDSRPTTHALRTDPRLKNYKAGDDLTGRTFRVAAPAKAVSKSKVLSVTSRGNKVSKATRVASRKTVRR